MSTCSWIAATAAGEAVAGVLAAEPAGEVDVVLPSTSSTRAPSARATTIGVVAIPRGTNCSRAARMRSLSVRWLHRHETILT